MSANDPRSRGFNYGSPIGGPNPPFYDIAVKVAFVLGRQASALGQKAWDLEMAIKEVRISCSEAEKAKALRALELALAPHLEGKEIVHGHDTPAAAA